MTVKLLAAGFAAAAAFGAAGLAAPVAIPVQPVVFGAPLPQEPAPQPGAALPSPEEVSGLLTKLTDPGVSYKGKENLVQNGLTSQEGHGLDHDLHKANREGELPYTFDVLNVAPAGPNEAVANVTISGPKKPAQTGPLQLVDQGGSWVLSHESAVGLMHELAP